MLFSFIGFKSLADSLSLIEIASPQETVKTVVASVLAFAISVIHSNFCNHRFVFKSGNKTFGMHIKSYFKTFLCYGVTGLIISPVIKVWLGNIGIICAIASMASLITTIPINFLLNKFWAFKNK